MRLKVLHMDKTNSTEIQALCKDFQKRAGRFMKLEVNALPKVKGKTSNPEELKEKEGQVMLKNIASGEYLVLLDEKGVSMKSRDSAEWLRQHYVNESREIVFLIGGAHGFSKDVYERADMKLSMSKMTFNHELALLVLLEQVYRMVTIIHGHPYHND